MSKRIESLMEIYLYGRPQVEPEQKFRIGDLDLDCWSGADMSIPFRTSFETVFAKFALFRGMHLEPDGSFLWLTREESGKQHELSGTFFDNGMHLLYVDIHGSCEEAGWLRFLEAIVDDGPLPAALLLGGAQKLIPAERMPRLWQLSLP